MSEHALTVACPTCLVPEGTRCTGTKGGGSNGGIVGAHPHRERTLASLAFSHGADSEWTKAQKTRTVRAVVDRLLEVTKACVTEISEHSRPWEAGAVALRWMEHEIAPLVADIEAQRARSSTIEPRSCPFCEVGESWTPIGWTSAISFSCGHRATPSNRNEKPQENAVLRVASLDMKITDQAQICVRPQTRAIHPQRFIILANPERWNVTDLKIGNYSQFTSGGDIPGEAFAISSELRIKMAICPLSMDITVSVRYVGADPDGELFEGVFYGFEVEDPNVLELRLRDAQNRAAITEERYAARERTANVHRVNDGRGGCSICKADQSMWCDAVEHHNAQLFPPLPHDEACRCGKCQAQRNRDIRRLIGADEP